MNKLERRLKGDVKFKKRLKNVGLTPKALDFQEKAGIKNKLFCYKTTGKPCSCWMCSPKDIKSKYKVKYKNKFDE